MSKIWVKIPCKNSITDTSFIKIQYLILVVYKYLLCLKKSKKQPWLIWIPNGKLIATIFSWAEIIKGLFLKKKYVRPTEKRAGSKNAKMKRC